ncbi:MAG: type II toxin-antitoxin system VapC family toxin [Chloroflexota bacterium]
MRVLYLDSSAFVKVVVAEAESAALRTYLAAAGSRFASSALLRTEAVRAVRHLGPDALTTVRDALRRVDLVSVDDRVLDAAGILEPKILRTLDAIHVATALALGDDLEAIITYDDRMLTAARALGLPAVAPH